MTDMPDVPAHWFQILLALSGGDLHGLGITKDVLERTEGRLHLWPGMLYGALKKMAALGFVVDADAPATFESGGGRPRFYHLTARGRRVCAAEATRMAALVETARLRKVIKPVRSS
jgi:DNA-binding PadR family transcriptional regulator